MTTTSTALAIFFLASAVVLIGGLAAVPAMQVATAQNSCPEGSTLQGGSGGAQCVVPVDEPAICPEIASEVAVLDESGNVIGTQCIDNTSGDSVEPVCADEDAELDELTGSGLLSDFVCRSTEPIGQPGRVPTTTVCVTPEEGADSATAELTQREITVLEREGATVTEGECPPPPDRVCVSINGADAEPISQQRLEELIAEGADVVILDPRVCGTE